MCTNLSAPATTKRPFWPGPAMDASPSGGPAAGPLTSIANTFAPTLAAAVFFAPLSRKSQMFCGEYGRGRGGTGVGGGTRYVAVSAPRNSLWNILPTTQLWNILVSNSLTNVGLPSLSVDVVHVIQTSSALPCGRVNIFILTT